MDLHLPATGNDHAPRIVIIGGGFSGAALAWHLHRIAPGTYRMVIIEPRDEIGRGLAYDNHDPAHRINVPAVKMNLDFDEEGHFQQWLIEQGYPTRDPASLIVSGHLYPSREAFGAYVGAHIRALGSAITHRKTKASTVIPTDTGYRVLCENGDGIEADVVVLAVCHAPPDVPASLKVLSTHPKFIADPWQRDALQTIAPDDRVLIVGTGLTMADIVASLDRLGHRGHITGISRRGLRSQAHAATETEPFGDFIETPAHTTLSLLRRVRRAIADAARQGLSWHPVLDQIRLQGTGIWRALPSGERAKLIKHLRPFWDTYRFRIAPQVDDIIRRRIADGTLTIRAASLRASATQNGAHPDKELAVEVRARRGKVWEHLAFDAVVIATGPAHGTVFQSNALLHQLQEAGLARPDPLGLGIEVDLQGHAIARDGRADDALFVAGPLARGTFGELMGAPDLARYVRSIAETINHRRTAGSRLPPRSIQA